jgi:hypothetical protein
MYQSLLGISWGLGYVVGALVGKRKMVKELSHGIHSVNHSARWCSRIQFRLEISILDGSK